MKKTDLIFIIVVAAIFVPFFVWEQAYDGFKWATKEHYFIMSFLKFGILATMGEMLGLRIKSGAYSQSGFGVIPRAITWGFLGMLIGAAFKLFGAGTPVLVEAMGITTPSGTPTYGELINNADGITATMSWYHLLAAFMISTFMNCIFAPVFMVIHKISDVHIAETGGTIKGYFSRFSIGDTMAKLDWHTIWNFLFKKTIPLFWIPAHTITFLLPTDLRVLVAAILGIALGVFMSIATKKK